MVKKYISHDRDSIEGKLVTAVDELKWPDCGNTTKETEKSAEVKRSDYVDVLVARQEGEEIF